MDKLVYSSVTHKSYFPSKSCRILNTKQQALYLEHRLTLLDIYPGIDVKTGNRVIVMVFDILETKPYFDLWCKHELT